MLLFNYEKIYMLSHGNSDLILYYADKVPGDNFIVNPAILKDTRYSAQHRAEYLGLCSFRNRLDYKKGIMHLELDKLPPWVPVEVAKQNPLIKVTNNALIFLMENK